LEAGHQQSPATDETDENLQYIYPSQLNEGRVSYMVNADDTVYFRKTDFKTTLNPQI
jgi:hypothetical protein